MFCIYLRTNSNLCYLQHKLIGFYNRDEKCLQRGTNWVFKYRSLRFVFKGLIFNLITCITPGKLRKKNLWHEMNLLILRFIFSNGVMGPGRNGYFVVLMISEICMTRRCSWQQIRNQYATSLSAQYDASSLPPQVILSFSVRCTVFRLNDPLTYAVSRLFNPLRPRISWSTFDITYRSFK